MRKLSWLAVALSAAVFGTAAWAGAEKEGEFRIKIRPTQEQGEMAMPGMQGGQPGMGMQGMSMPMMQQCMQMHQKVMERIEHLDKKIDHILNRAGKRIPPAPECHRIQTGAHIQGTGGRNSSPLRGFRDQARPRTQRAGAGNPLIGDRPRWLRLVTCFPFCASWG